MAKILVVEDDQVVRRVIVRALNERAHDVLQATNGVEALQLYQENPADLVITDLIMPEKDGIELIRELQGIREDVKVIAMSGGGRHGKLELLDLAEAFGAQRVLSKPIHIDALVEAVGGVLDDNS